MNARPPAGRLVTSAVQNEAALSFLTTGELHATKSPDREHPIERYWNNRHLQVRADDRRTFLKLPDLAVNRALALGK